MQQKSDDELKFMQHVNLINSSLLHYRSSYLIQPVFEANGGMLSAPTLGIAGEESIKERDQRVLPISDAVGAVDFSDLLDDIDFDCLFVGINDGDLLPDLEVDSENAFAELSASSGSEVNALSCSSAEREEKDEKRGEGGDEEERKAGVPVAGGSEESASSPAAGAANAASSMGRKPLTGQAKASHGKRKVKVDWTPELHRRFVQAVEQLGIDKAVPSRILELMGIDCLTRHNVASHLQKYRSHRKHLLAREAEAANFNQRRQIYGTYGGAGGGGKRGMRPWISPTIGFPTASALHPFRPLHVWGHPTVDHRSLIHVWPNHIVHSPSPPPPPPPPTCTASPPPPLAGAPYWQIPYHSGSKEGWFPNVYNQGMPCFSQPPIAPQRFPAAVFPGVPPHAMHKTSGGVSILQAQGQTESKIQFDFHPSKETIDAAVGDVLAKPWLPLPLGLKPPSLESVLVELQQQGISKVPPSCA